MHLVAAVLFMCAAGCRIPSWYVYSRVEYLIDLRFFLISPFLSLIFYILNFHIIHTIKWLRRGCYIA